jgi:glycosyltransferase involved in cell wall biosynthesis
MKTPKITIVTPSFNQGSYLERCIQSVINQDYPNLEFIILDGGSLDNSVDIIKKYERYLTYWQSQADGGQATAIKEGFNRGKGEIYGWLNSDDIFCKNSLFKVAQAFNEHKEIGLLYGKSFLVNEKGQFLKALIPEQVDLKKLIYSASSIFQGSTFFSRKAYCDAGGINESYIFSMEYELFYKIAQSSKILYLPEFLACYRIHPLSKGQTISSIGTEELSCILEENFQIRLDSVKYKILNFYFQNRRRLRQLMLGELSFLNRSYYSEVFQKNVYDY